MTPTYTRFTFFVSCIESESEKNIWKSRKKLEIELERLKMINSSSNKTMAGLIADIMIKALEGKTIEEHTRIGDDIQARIDWSCHTYRRQTSDTLRVTRPN